MKVLLVNPNRYHYQGAKGPRATLPLGIMYIASYLEKHFVNVKIFDSLTSPSTGITKMDSVTIHGVTDEDFMRVISNELPDIVGIGFPFTAQLEGALNAAKRVKEVNPKIIVVAGGPHVSVAGEDLLRNNLEIDYGVRGEGEVVMLNIVNALADNTPLENIPGLIYRFGAVVKSNPPELIKDLDSLPLPAYHLIDMDRFFIWVQEIAGRAIKGHTRSISMITSRGCPFNCVFCSIHLHMGKRFRYHSAAYVVSHLEHVTKELGVTHVAFEDDNLTFKPERCVEIFSSVREKKIPFNWHTPNGVRADFLDEDLLRLMKQSGCIALTVAPESGSQQTLNNIINKKLDLNKVIQVAELCKKLEIPLSSYFVIGLPGETKADMQMTVDFAIMLYDKYNVIPSIFSATPLVGTRLYDIVISNGYLAKDITPKNLMAATQAASGEPMIRTPDFTPGDVKKLAGQASALLKSRNENKGISVKNPQPRTKGVPLKYNDGKITSLLHIVPYSFNQPEHKFLGSTKDILCRTEYFRERGINVKILAPAARSDRSLLPELSKMDLSKYQAVLIEKADYPLSMLHIKNHAPHAKLLLRGHNAEFYHHMHRIIARTNGDWHNGMRTHFRENMWDMEVALKWGNRDNICSRLADAVLSITDWERLNYWNLLTNPDKVFTVPSFLAKDFITAGCSDNKRDLCVCYMSNGINPMLIDSGKQFNYLVEALPEPYENWEFAMTGDADKMGINLSQRITKLGLLDDPFTILKEARCIAILSDFGFGLKTKILDAVSQKCWTIVTPGLYEYLPDIIKPLCIPLQGYSVDDFKKALKKSKDKFPAGDPNAQLRDVAFNTLDHVFGFNGSRVLHNTGTRFPSEDPSEMSEIFEKTMKAISQEFKLLKQCNIDAATGKVDNGEPKKTGMTFIEKMLTPQLVRKKLSNVKTNFLQKLRQLSNF